MKKIRIAWTCRALVATVLLATASGCETETTGPRQVDTGRARTALRDVLESWKRGEPHDAPSRQTPPIRVADEDWLAGDRLVGYQIGTDDRVVGAALDCPVVLSLQGRDGENLEKSVVYSVGTDPTLMIVRHDGL